MNGVSIFRRTAAHTDEPSSDVSVAGRIFMLDINDISPNPSQPRKNFDGDAIARLADSIRSYGILQPITVRRRSLPSGYELIAGERRLRAARLIGLGEIPSIIVEADDRRSAEMALVENIQRENLNIFEQASAIASLIDMYDLTQEEVARQLSASQSYVANKLRLLRLTEPERRLILTSKLGERHARALLRLDTPQARMSALEVIIAREMNVAATEQYIERILASDDTVKPHPKPRLILKDVRILYNTIDRALDSVRSAGINVSSSRRETESAVEVIIVMRKS